MNSPCHECTQRRIGCHSKCEDYKAYSLYCDVIRKMRAIENEGKSAAIRQYRKRVNKFLRDKQR